MLHNMPTDFIKEFYKELQKRGGDTSGNSAQLHICILPSLKPMRRTGSELLGYPKLECSSGNSNYLVILLNKWVLVRIYIFQQSFFKNINVIAQTYQVRIFCSRPRLLMYLYNENFYFLLLVSPFYNQVYLDLNFLP